jgi:ribonuclease-3
MSVSKDGNLSILAKQIGLGKVGLKEALTHPSNKRMGWLGDAVLYLAVTEHLYGTSDAPASQLDPDRQRTIENPNLKKTAAEKLQLNKLIRVPPSERDPNSERIMATAFEALIGALFIEKGYEATAKFVVDFFSTIQPARGNDPANQ